MSISYFISSSVNHSGSFKRKARPERLRDDSARRTSGRQREGRKTDNGADSYRRFLAGDDGGIAEIIRDYKDCLTLFLNRYVNDIHTAEELTEDTFFRLVTKKPRFVPKYSFKTWLYTIGRNTAVNHLRRAGKRDAFAPAPEELSPDTETLERTVIRQEEKITLHRALSRINPLYAQALYLKYFEEQTNEQIAVILKKTRRQVENILYQARRSLKAELEKEGFIYEEL